MNEMVRWHHGCDNRPAPEFLVIVRPWAGHPGQFIAHHNGYELCRSRSPLLSAARVLLAMGIPADAQIAMQHEGREEIALLSTVGYAAARSVDERFTVFRRYDPPRRKPGVLAPQSRP